MMVVSPNETGNSRYSSEEEEEMCFEHIELEA